VRHPEGPRFLRRLARREAGGQTKQQRRAAELAERHIRWIGDPRAGEDRRQAERRSENLTGQALDARLAELGITGDRRKGQRRTGGDRRR
jgi:hypothetical protein